ncbi:hypothetical protein B5M09_007374 [Aphanomyces astaci]|uniref:Uncharacterized protein n=1 Tax=Aphanomyces astaci TaxID=112090 RepID=A0A425D391_APHAT|nr:hypothetical protein B5M09_007374 [Aphanomyces astaci]
MKTILDSIWAWTGLFSYRFDELISTRRGQIAALILVGGAIIVGVSPVVVFSNHTTFFGSLYETAVDILDPKIEMPRSDKGDTMTFLWISRGCTFSVFVITSLYANVMVGFVVDWIVVKMEAVDKGTHAIVETNHSVLTNPVNSLAPN